PLLEATGYEADDVIGTIATAAERDGWEVHIVSGDLDMLQLVSTKIHLLHTAKGGADAIVEYDPERVFARYGLAPEQMVDFKSLKGDSSDNIPGVPGVGEKTASKLIATFGSLEQLYQRLDEVEPARIREALAANRDAAFAGQGLMTIDRDAPLTLPATGGEIGEYDRDAALALFRDLEFRALAQRLPPLAGEDRAAAQAAVSAAAAGAALRGAAPSVTKAAPKASPASDLQLGFDFDAVTAVNAAAGRSTQVESSTADETDAHAKIEQVKRGELAAAGIRILRSAEEARDAFRRLAQHGHLAIGGGGADRRGPEAELAIAIVDDAGPILAADDGAVVHALLQSLASAQREIAGLAVKGLIGAMVSIRPEASPRLIDDVALGTWISNVTMRNPGLVEVASARLGADLPDRREPLQEAVLSALVTRASRGPLAEELREAGTLRLYREIELPLVEVLARMEIAGVAVDQAALAELGSAFGAEIT
ncbi:MAG: 5'-3' exonuclease H3TH domain-containing protein, partial [Candidatus Limnocylindrus sp.]